MDIQTVIPNYQSALNNLVHQLEDMLPAEQLAIFNRDAEALATAYARPLQVREGDKASDFQLPNATGKLVQLETLLQQGPVVLTFYRGAWCPYCNLQLRQYQQILPQIKAKGASLVAISPQTPDHSLDMQQKNELDFEVLTDIGNLIARQFTTVFQYSEASVQAMAELGYDFFDFYDDESREIPIPATFVIAPDGIIRFAHSAGGDYRERTEAEALLEAL